MRYAPIVLIVAISACSSPQRAPEANEEAIADTLRALVTDAYDFSKPDAERRLMSLYPDAGRVVSAAAGQVTTSRDSLEATVREFWRSTGQNMQHPRWEWRDMHVDVLSPDAAVATATYRIPHHTPDGSPHVVGGAWTMVFQRRDGRWVIVQEHLSDGPALHGAAAQAVIDSANAK